MKKKKQEDQKKMEAKHQMRVWGNEFLQKEIRKDEKKVKKAHKDFMKKSW